ncbi:MAG: hypothetical protein GWN55_06445, partial [Phycisphaerae bacterium]|nr:hypothetical protein [Phycisphaerae bacterium]NIR26499.1 hypothetical protein [Gammaproteobacteria bacterium]NIV00953.1 hypothetical protein [Phycisphaerae bacterium]
TFCNGEAGIVRGTGWVNESIPYILEADLTVECFTTGASLDFHATWIYDPGTDTISSGGITYHRPGNSGGTIPPAQPLYLRVNYGHDWVESFYEDGHTVWIAVMESDGVTVKATAATVTEPKDFWGGETADISTNSTSTTPSTPPPTWACQFTSTAPRWCLSVQRIRFVVDKIQWPVDHSSNSYSFPI